MNTMRCLNNLKKCPLKLRDEDVLNYFISQQKPGWRVCRWLLSIYCFIALVLWTTLAKTNYNVMAYLTTWTYIVLCMYFFLAAIVSVFGIRVGNNREALTSLIEWGHGIFLVLWKASASTSSVFGVIVTTVYYSAICSKDPTCYTFENINIHGLNSIFLVLDFLFSCRPVSFSQIIFPVIFGLVYIIFTAVIWATNHDNVIYRIMDWNKPGKSIGFTMIILVLGFIIQLLYVIIYYLKTCSTCQKYSSCFSPSQNEEVVKQHEATSMLNENV